MCVSYFWCCIHLNGARADEADGRSGDKEGGNRRVVSRPSRHHHRPLLHLRFAIVLHEGRTLVLRDPCTNALVVSL